uniref:Uncharacterized protein n=1 Tax=Molossus molossus TaxID=27622 RepID=A0A7J8EEY6_MOLMO|nr:hypothetical protein HJG59_008810 [Molossus molossus]
MLLFTALGMWADRPPSEVERASFLGRCSLCSFKHPLLASTLCPLHWLLFFFFIPRILTQVLSALACPCAHLPGPLLPQRGANCPLPAAPLPAAPIASRPCRPHARRCLSPGNLARQSLTPGSSAHCLSKGKLISL